MKLPLGDGTVDVDFSDQEVTVARPPGGDAVVPENAAATAIDDPHGPPLSERVGPDDEIAIVTTDLTRATPDERLLSVLLDRLAAAGVSREAITVVVGLGLHRPLTDAEIERAYGEYADLVVNHDPDAAVEVGTVTDAGTDVPISVHPAVASADAVLSTGMVEPHQYAGFSGGAKTVVIGAGGEPLIEYTHGPELLGRPGVRLGRIDDNPFRSLLDRAGDVAGVDFCINVTHGPSGILGASAGDPRAVVEELAGVARAALSVPVDAGYDAVVAGVGAPKDANLYQASRGATYVALGATDPLASGGRIVVPAKLQEGAGDGTGERRFYRWLSEAEDAPSLYEAMADGYDPGAQRAFVLARVLREYDVVVVNSQCPDLVEDCLLDTAGSVESALDPGEAVLVVPDAINTLLVADDS